MRYQLFSNRDVISCYYHENNLIVTRRPLKLQEQGGPLASAFSQSDKQIPLQITVLKARYSVK